MIKLVIFDLDGTLLNTLEDLANSCNYILEKNNFPTHPIDNYKNYIGGGMKNLIQKSTPKNATNPNIINKITEEFTSYYRTHSEIKTAPYPGIIELLYTLSSRNIKLAIASNKIDPATKALSKKYFTNIHFDSILGQRENTPTKPNPQIIYDTINQIGIINKTDILYIGDTDTDMKTAANAGVTSIGVLWGFRTREELNKNGANYLAKEPKDIIHIIDMLNKQSQ